VASGLGFPKQNERIAGLGSCRLIVLKVDLFKCSQGRRGPMKASRSALHPPLSESSIRSQIAVSAASIFEKFPTTLSISVRMRLCNACKRHAAGLRLGLIRTWLVEHRGIVLCSGW